MSDSDSNLISALVEISFHGGRELIVSRELYVRIARMVEDRLDALSSPNSYRVMSDDEVVADSVNSHVFVRGMSVKPDSLAPAYRSWSADEMMRL